MTSNTMGPTSKPSNQDPSGGKKPSTAKPAQLVQGGLELVVLRNNFYRDNYRRLMLVCLGLIFLAASLIFWGLYERTHQPQPRYFATTYDGKLIPLLPLDQANLSDNALLQWCAEAAINSYTFNFVNFRKALQDVRIYFTKTGYQYFLKALKDSNNLDAVQNKKLVVSATPTGAPVILRKGLLNGVFSWTVQLPMEIDYRSATDQFRQNIVLIMIITRVSTLESPQGVGIESFVTQEARR